MSFSCTCCVLFCLINIFQVQVSSSSSYVNVWVNNYRQPSNIRSTLVGNKIVLHSHAVGVSRFSNYIFILDRRPGFKGLGKDNCKTRREAFKFWDLVRLILDIFTCHKFLLTVISHPSTLLSLVVGRSSCDDPGFVIMTTLHIEREALILLYSFSGCVDEDSYCTHLRGDQCYFSGPYCCASCERFRTNIPGRKPKLKYKQFTCSMCGGMY